jgi:hypothetical protein
MIGSESLRQSDAERPETLNESSSPSGTTAAMNMRKADRTRPLPLLPSSSRLSWSLGHFYEILLCQLEVISTSIPVVLDSCQSLANLLVRVLVRGWPTLGCLGNGCAYQLALTCMGELKVLNFSIFVEFYELCDLCHVMIIQNCS